MKHILILLIAVYFTFAPTTAFAQTPLSIQNITTTPAGTIPLHDKFEISFTVNTSAQNPQFPYDPNPPTGVTARTGVTVDAVFTSPSNQTIIQPAFYYQEFLDENKTGGEWFYPTGTYKWKVRFSPKEVGSWSFRLRAQDASNCAIGVNPCTSWSESSPQSFQVVNSTNKGFIRVSPNDPRYFEFENGEYFPNLGYNLNYNRVDWINPSTRTNLENFQKMSENGIQYARIWLTQWGIFSSNENPWKSHTGSGSFLTFEDSYDNHELSMVVNAAGNRCMFTGWNTAQPAIKRNANYKVQIRYKVTNIDTASVINASQPYGFVAKIGGWLWNGDGQSCYNAGIGTVVTPHITTVSPDWQVVEGTITATQLGNVDFLPNFYLTMENLNVGRVLVDEVSIKELDGQGNEIGANIVNKPTMNHHMYFEQRNSYAFDKVLDLAKQYNIYLRPVILEKGEWIQNHIDSAGNFTQTPVTNDGNFYGNFRSMTKVRWLQTAWWRYLQARWGYSSNIHSWELLNEGDPASDRHFTQTDELGKYMRQFAPYNHIISTSTWHSFPKSNFWASSNYPNVDFADIHKYINPSGTSSNMDYNFFDSAQATFAIGQQVNNALPTGPVKPVIRGETGFVDSGTEPPTARTDFMNDAQNSAIWLHDMVWGGINSSGLIDAGNWYPDTHIYRRQGNGAYIFDKRNVFKTYYDFIKDIPLSNGNYVDIAPTVGNSTLRAWGQKDTINGNAHVWIQNKNHTWKNVADNVTIAPETGGVVVCGFDTFANTNLALETWNTYNGTKQTGTIPVQSSGCLTLSITNLTTDVAYKILNPSQPSPTPSNTPAPGDVNGDGSVNLTDLSTLLANFGGTGKTRQQGDVSGNDGIVNLSDLSTLLANFGR